jgi:hypothetical protein
VKKPEISEERKQKWKNKGFRSLDSFELKKSQMIKEGVKQLSTE